MIKVGDLVQLSKTSVAYKQGWRFFGIVTKVEETDIEKYGFIEVYLIKSVGYFGQREEKLTYYRSAKYLEIIA